MVVFTEGVKIWASYGSKVRPSSSSSFSRSRRKRRARYLRYRDDESNGICFDFEGIHKKFECIFSFPPGGILLMIDVLKRGRIHRARVPTRSFSPHSRAHSLSLSLSLSLHAS